MRQRTGHSGEQCFRNNVFSFAGAFKILLKSVVFCKVTLLPLCPDINECTILDSNPNKKNTSGLQSCHEKARCVNTAGSYRCQCIKGYAGTGFTCVGRPQFYVIIM